MQVMPPCYSLQEQQGPRRQAKLYWVLAQMLAALAAARPNQARCPNNPDTRPPEPQPQPISAMCWGGSVMASEGNSSMR